MKQHQRPNKGATHIWLTPPEILTPLGEFDVDPCAAPSPRPWPTAKHHIELPDDGLNAQWGGRVWLNPPFDAAIRPLFMKRMAEHQNGVMLIPAAPETKAFRKYVWSAASAVLFLDKRPSYCYPDGRKAKANSGSSMCLVSYDADARNENLNSLANSGLGVLVHEWSRND